MGLLDRAKSSVRARVTAAVLLVALVVATVGAFLFVTTLRSALEQGLMTSAKQEVDSVQAQLKAGEPPGQAVVSGRNDVIVQIVSDDGRVVATDHQAVITPLRRTPGSARDVRVKGLVDPYIVVAERERGGTGLIAVGRSSEQVSKATSTAAILFGVFVPLALALLALAVWVSVGRALRPVEAMRREAAVITSAHLDRRLPITPGDDEIPRLARTLNEMLDRIDASQRLQRQFVSDASHELRSPLATLRQLAEVAEGYPGRVETADLAADVLAEEQRMEDLVNALLVLARLDDGPSPRDDRPVDLDDLVLMEARRQRNGGARIDVSGVSAGQVAGHPVLLGQAVRNLLANAVRHARDRVTVTLDEHDDRVLLVVDDNGPGIPEEERTRVFERFVRLDESRAREDGGGAGLGLAIVRKVVESSGGTVVVGDAPGGGARMTVSLPAVASGS
jgi:signal transduction histidine kinase